MVKVSVELHEAIEKELSPAKGDPRERRLLANRIAQHIHMITNADQPVGYVQWTPIEDVEANDYNPNAVATNEMRLLYTSISHDGYTQPVVTIWNEERQKYTIIDGFHRYSTMRQNKDIMELNHGLLPIVVLNKSINERMAATVRHNRARGKHSVNGMGNIVFNMLKNGMTDDAICTELGLEVEELLRLKHITGFSKLFKDVEYGKAWETTDQLRVRKKLKESGEDIYEG